MKMEALMLSMTNLGPENGKQSGVGIVYFRMSSLQNLKGPLLRFSNVAQTVIFFNTKFTPPKKFFFFGGGDNVRDEKERKKRTLPDL